MSEPTYEDVVRALDRHPDLLVAKGVLLSDVSRALKGLDESVMELEESVQTHSKEADILRSRLSLAETANTKLNEMLAYLDRAHKKDDPCGDFKSHGELALELVAQGKSLSLAEAVVEAAKTQMATELDMSEDHSLSINLVKALKTYDEAKAQEGKT